MWRHGPLPALTAGTVALIGWVWALFGPTGRYSTAETSSVGGTSESVSVTETGWTSVWSSQDLGSVTVVFLLIMLLSSIGILAGGLLHGTFGLPAGRVVLWGSSIMLLAGAVLSSFSIGLLLMPGALLGLVAAIWAGSSPDRTERPVSQAGSR